MTVRTCLIVLGCWFVVAIAFTSQQIATAAVPIDVGGLLAILLPTLLFDSLWALMTIAIVVTVTRFPSGDGRTTRFVFLHAALSVAANLSTGIFIYWLVLGVIVAIGQRRRARERQRAQDALERNLADTRAAMLRAQLQPHFLFNTLNTIAALIPEDPRNAERMVARLGDLLRLSLDGTRGTSVTLAEDLSVLDAYLAIETLRLGDRLRIARDIAPETLSARVPDLLLQPLAENAVRHGLASTRAGGTLSITSRREGDLLRIDVSDDGAGIDPAEICEGIGLRNSRERITLIAGAAAGAGLVVRSSPGSGFTVTARMPWAKA